LTKLLRLLEVIPGWVFFLLSYVFPRDQKIVVFGIHTGAFSGNIKALLLEDTSLGTNTKKIFIGKNQAIVNTVQSFGIEAYTKYSLKGIWYALRASTCVYSSYLSDINYWLSGGAKYVNVWHGTPLKKIERDVNTGYYALRNKYKRLYILAAPYFFVKPDILLVASEYEKKCFKSAFDVKDDIFLSMFPPRLKTYLSEDFNANLRSKILYAPTWRDDHSFTLEEYIDFDRMNDFLSHMKYTLYIKLHPSDNSCFKGRWSNIVVASQEEDIYTLMKECKILITDYSSMLFEYLYIDRDVVLFCPDNQKYQKRSREFYFDICKEPLGEIALDFESLLEVLKAKIENKKTQQKLKKAYLPYAEEEDMMKKIIQRLYGQY